jgi:hypothetical protein
VIQAEQFRALLTLFHDRIRLVFLNTNEVEQLCGSLAESIDFVIGMSGQVSDDDAIRFASAFYEAIADRKSVKTAFEFALANLPKGEHKAYKLFVERGGADPYLLPPARGRHEAGRMLPSPARTEI